MADGDDAAAADGGDAAAAGDDADARDRNGALKHPEPQRACAPRAKSSDKRAKKRRRGGKTCSFTRPATRANKARFVTKVDQHATTAINA